MPKTRPLRRSLTVGALASSLAVAGLGGPAAHAGPSSPAVSAGPSSAGLSSAGPSSAGLSSTGLSSAGLSSAGPSSAGLSSAGTTSATAAEGTVSALATTKYTFVARNADGTPVRWDPCSPVHYRINRNGVARKGEVKYVKSAVKKVAKATGIRFVYDGSTSVVPDSMNIPAKAKTDIVFAWAAPGKGRKKSAALPKSSNVLGVGGISYASGQGGLRVFRAEEGAVVIKASTWKKLNRRMRTSLYLHELGHAVGLNHSSKSTQVMYPTLSMKPPTEFRKYDKLGLKKLGRSAGCVRPPGKPGAPTLTSSGTQLVVGTTAVKSYGKSLRYVLKAYFYDGTTKAWTSTSPTFTITAPNQAATLIVGARDSLGEVYNNNGVGYLPE